MNTTIATITNEDNVLKLHTHGTGFVFAWIDPEGNVCTAIDTALADLARLNASNQHVKVAGTMMRRAVQALHD